MREPRCCAQLQFHSVLLAGSTMRGDARGRYRTQYRDSRYGAVTRVFRKAPGAGADVCLWIAQSQRTTNTGSVAWVSTRCVSLPRSALTPARPCDAITIKSQFLSRAASMIPRQGWAVSAMFVVQATPAARAAVSTAARRSLATAPARAWKSL